jgi:hypothetical protein
MDRFSQKRLPLIILTAYIALAAVFAEAFVFAALDHDHVDGDCPVCLQIEAAQNLVKGFVLINLAILLTGLAVYAKTFVKNSTISYCILPTPVLLKVRSNS